MPNHYLNQCWVIVNWILRNKLQWNFNQNTKFSFTKMHLKLSSAKWSPFCPSRDELSDVSVTSKSSDAWSRMVTSKYFCQWLLIIWLRLRWWGEMIENGYRDLSPWASYQIRKIAGCACAGNTGNVSPPPRVSDPEMHHDTCVTHVPWCMPGSVTSGFLWSWGRENVPGIPGACTTHNFAYLVRGP